MERKKQAGSRNEYQRANRVASFFLLPASWLTLAFIFIGLIYSTVTPLFENGDEEYHFQYALGLARGEGLPVVGQSPLGQIAGHPPLYYALGSLVLRFADTSDLDSYFRMNPHAQLARFDQPHNANRFIHTSREAFPYRGTALAVHLLRWLTLAAGAATIIFTGLIAAELFPDRPSAVWAASGFVAFLPQFLVTNSSVRNDALLVALSAAALWLAIRAVLRGLSAREAIALGLLCGLAALTKTSGLLLTGFAFMGVAIGNWRLSRSRKPVTPSEARRLHEGFFGRSASRRALRMTFRDLLRLRSAPVGLGIRDWRLVAAPLRIAALTALIAGWWYARNWLVYGDLTAARAMLGVVGDRTLKAWQVIAGDEPFLWSWWGTAGWLNIALPRWVYWTLDALAVVALVGAGWGAWKDRGRQSAVSRRRSTAFLLLASWIIVVYAAVVNWAQHAPLGYDGRLAFPALPALAVLFAAGWIRLIPPRHSRALGIVVLAAWATLAVAFPLFWIRPAYARPRILTEADLPATMFAVNQDYAGEARLRGLTLSPEQARPGDDVTVTLYWQALTTPTRPYSVILSLLGRSQQVIAHADTYPGRGNYPMDLWETGQIVEDRYRLRLAPDAITPTRVQVFTGLWLIETGETLEPAPAILRAAPTLRLLPAKRESAPPQQVLASFGGSATLIGYTVTPDVKRVAPGERIKIALDWTTTTTMAEDFTVFTHLIDSAGELAGQADRQPADGDWPTSFWLPGMAWRDEYEFAVSPQATPGTARIEIGLYRLADGTRLALDSGGASFTLSTPVEIRP